MAGKLFDELSEARFALGLGGFLMSFRHGRAHREEIAYEQRQGFDLDVLVALQAFKLARQPVQPLGCRRLALVTRVRRQPGGQRRSNNGRLGHAFLGGQFVKALGVLGLDEEIQSGLTHRWIPSSGSRDASRALRCSVGSSWLGRESGKSSSSSSERSLLGGSGSGL
ncbi:hypothetical protein D3C78_1494600 [compost metagenome]